MQCKSNWGYDFTRISGKLEGSAAPECSGLDIHLEFRRRQGLFHVYGTRPNKASTRRCRVLPRVLCTKKDFSQDLHLKAPYRVVMPDSGAGRTYIRLISTQLSQPEVAKCPRIPPKGTHMAWVRPVARSPRKLKTISSHCVWYFDSQLKAGPHHTYLSTGKNG